MPPCLVTLRSATDRGLAYLASRVAAQCQVSRYHDPRRRPHSTVPERRSALERPDAATESDFLDFILDNAKSSKARRQRQPGPVREPFADLITNEGKKSVQEPVAEDATLATPRSRPEPADVFSLQGRDLKARDYADLLTMAEQDKRTKDVARRSDRYAAGRSYAQSLRRARLTSRRRQFRPALSGQPLAAKMIPLRSMSRPSDVFLSLWNVNFAKLSARYDRHHKVHGIEDDSVIYLEPISPFLDRRTPDVAKKALEQADGQTGSLSLDALGQIADGRSPVLVWAEVILWLLANDPVRAPEFLLATHVGPYYPPLKCVEDAVDYLTRHYHYSGRAEKEAHIAKLLSTLDTLSERTNGEKMKLRGSTIRHLLRYCSPQDMAELYQNIVKRDLSLHPLTYTHFATAFAGQGDLEQAISALLRAHAKGCHLQSYAFMSTCATLLRASMEQPGGLRMCLRLIDNLVEIGVKLNTHLTNIIMLNAIDSKESDTAMSIFSSMTTNGVQPDEYTFAILLKLCKADIDNAAALRDIIQLAVEQSDVRGNAVLATEILHCLALHHTKHNPKSAFRTLADAYVGLFDLGPVQALGINMPGRSTAGDATGPLNPGGIAPPPQALTVLLSVYLQHVSVDEARRLYLQWREMVKAGDKCMRELASTTHLPNAFVKAFTTRKDTLLVAAEVIKNMQRYSENLSGEGSGAGHDMLASQQSTSTAAPDVYTFSIFLEGFLRHGQEAFARQILTHMRKQGIEPTTVTWNIVVSGYAGMQKLQRVYEGIRELWKSGQAFDEWTYKGLSRLNERNRIKLKAKVADLELGKRMHFTEELKQTLGDRLRRAAQEETKKADEKSSL